MRNTAASVIRTVTGAVRSSIVSSLQVPDGFTVELNQLQEPLHRSSSR